MLRFVQISDSHIGPAPDFELEGVRTRPAFEKLVEEIARLPFRPDFIVHTGDLAALPDEGAYASAAAILERLGLPIYFVAGNHDSPKMMKSLLRMPGARDLDPGGDLLTYRFEHGGRSFMTLDACGDAEIEPHGRISARQLEILAGEIASSPPDLIFVHFPALSLDVPWVDSDMLILNGSDMHELLRSSKGKVRAVFYGHVHRGMQIARDGILYQSCPTPFHQIAALPTDREVLSDPRHRPGFNLVSFDGASVIVKEIRL